MSCDKAGILPIVYSKQYNIRSVPNLVFPQNQNMLNGIPAYVQYNLQG